MKVGKSTTEEKEQLEHTVLKVKNDLDEMKAKYQETVSTINALISDPTMSLVMKDVMPADSGYHYESNPVPHQQELSNASVAHLKKMNQLVSAQMEKTDAKLRAKLADLDSTKQDLQQRIRYNVHKT